VNSLRPSEVQGVKLLSNDGGGNGGALPITKCGFRFRSLRYATFAPLKRGAWTRTFAAVRGSAGGPAGKRWRRAGNL
jgi:hypothetical protein